MSNVELCKALTGATSTEELKAAADNLAVFVKENGVAALEGSDGVLKTLDATLGDSKNAVAREGGAFLFAALSKKLKGAAVPFLVSRLAVVVENAGDKKSAECRKASSKGAKAFLKVMNAPAAAQVYDMLMQQAQESTKWQVKVLALELLAGYVEIAPEFVARKMVVVVPAFSDLMWDSKKQVKEAAAKALTEACKCINNNDVQPFVPALVSAISNPSEVEECVHTLAATTFVQTVDASALAITVPLLERGFREKSTATKRKCAVITENLAKLVDNPANVAPFMPVLEPALAKASDEVADPECRSRCAAAHSALQDIAKRGGALKAVEAAPLEKVEEAVKNVIAKVDGASIEGPGKETSFKFVASSARYMTTLQDSTTDDWKEELFAAVKALLPAGANKKSDAEEVAKQIHQACLSGEAAATGGVQEEFEEDEDDKHLEQLCDCRFSLAYGSRILLNNARLYLKRGMRYGIVAAKSAGKTTLLQSIAKGQVEGFPVDKLKTVFVHHDIQASQARMSVTDFTLSSVQEEMGISREEVRDTLDKIGFTDEMKDMPITSLSGGWKMKLALARAMLRKADILLLDEPTNHLDVLNVQWVVDYLTGDVCSNVTSLIVSHDTKFLDNVATHIIHFDTLKLNNYKGNLSKFVERFPHAKAYYDLTASTLAFKFPTPAPLDGVKSRGRPILSMTDVSFTYPGAPKPQLEGVSIRVSMASRIACVGANGAGKSTMIKLLTGELKPNKGTVYKHPNCNFAYVAQHAFHHIEQHLNKTAVQYLQWRFGSDGTDKEALVKSTVKISEEEEKKMKEPIQIQVENEDGKLIKEKRVVEKILGRRKQGKILEYEVKWVNKSQDMNSWFPREKLEELGFKKLLDDVDRRKAAAEGAFSRVLTTANAEAHFEAVGLDRELASHNRISSLSGGQKVKVVLAAATWSQPHLIILDEPTNYLDREALGALAQAINSFEGGVCLITHNQEFADATTRETWVVANHRCDIKGDADWAAYAAEALELAAEEEQVDALGNKIEKKRLPSSIKPKEKKKMVKELKKKIKDDLDMTDFEEECATEWGLFSA
eukprot:CAMPEP_0203765356 /NCGR_PEP_ID=MMETSP0098-20131031/18347_1 /ASSEMBLY_ACC=CAM_ASM_000208 /TAXON_ID=96639 /ORGANISM=" , Strain NY0313808BC1" /LENGTH=1064 /DNA_ID=CAMNT_0050661605 /DNA_START=1391 /DNA_END=4585 /DNA_ORIENTATION=+